MAWARRRGKYNAKRTMVDSIWFASKAESRRYSQLKLMEKAGKIAELTLQPRFPIVVKGKACGLYVADFEYYENEERVIEDCKGFRTPVYQLKKRIVEALYGITITEVTA